MTAVADPLAPVADEAAGALAERLFGGVLATMELFTAHLGWRFGFYEQLREARTYEQVAAATGVLPRYVREWCEQQAAAGILTVDDPEAAPEERGFALPEGHASALLDPDHPAAPRARRRSGPTPPWI